MLSSDPEKAKHTVLCDKPELEEEGFRYEEDFLDQML